MALNFDVECSISDDNAVASKAAVQTVKQIMKDNPVICTELLKTGLIDQHGPTKSAESIETFLNRMLGCSVDSQEVLYDKLIDNYTMIKVDAQNKGSFDEGMKGTGFRFKCY